MERRVQVLPLGSVATRESCQGGASNDVLHQLPPPLHAVSSQPRGDVSRTRLVAPTAITCGDVAGNVLA
jgi:hypothetical protein